ncbi:hypothetical protein ISN35_04405 [Xanthomonas translucens pv. undulosa]|uniref:hypothetical protein n=1 Tax=Xanthomonas campestris pv. translucens TaxID=343 RepID=UPI0019D58FF7|nr:hypothetical protein [Xanthomonas translucens]QSQ42281.1 hypothetical protein ISN33_03415 [Xanthomonas translucens pv. translucens]QSQ49872.1 hypothetical protein ISN35_04405 [Xanthomonas translucens pv. undulosa]
MKKKSLRYSVDKTNVSLRADPQKAGGYYVGAEKSQKEWLGVIAGSILTALLTIFGTFLLNREAREQQRQVQIVQEAELAAAGTISELHDSQGNLRELLEAALQSPKDKFQGHDLPKYLNFRVKWRQSLIRRYFVTRRYFGQDLADKVINVRGIKSSINSSDSVGKDDAGNRDVVWLSDQIEANIIALSLYKNDMGRRDAFLSIYQKIKLQRETEEKIERLMEVYEVHTVAIFQEMDERLNALGKSQVLYVANEKQG